MNKKERNQSGFGIVEAMIVLVVILLVGALGYYVWHKSRNAEDKGVASGSAKLLLIEDWSMQIPYTSTDTLSSYSNTENQVLVGSKQLGEKYGSLCARLGAGVISRVRGTDVLSTDKRAEYGSGYKSYNDLYAQKLGIFASATKVSGYIYYFLHSADYCSETQIIGNSSKNSHDAAARVDIDATNYFVKSILPNIQPLAP